MRIIKRTLLASLVCVGLIQLAGCNTIAGMGKDTQAAGRSLENAAKK